MFCEIQRIIIAIIVKFTEQNLNNLSRIELGAFSCISFRLKICLRFDKCESREGTWLQLEEKIADNYFSVANFVCKYFKNVMIIIFSRTRQMEFIKRDKS